MCNEQDPLSLFKGLQMGIFGFSQKEIGAKSAAMATTQKVSICTFLVPSLKNTATIFLVILLIQCFTVQVERFMTSSFS